MKQIIAAMITLAMFSCHSAPSYAGAEIKVENNRIKVKENGVTKDYGTIRKVREKGGNVEVYTNKNYNKPAVTFNNRGKVSTQEFSHSKRSTYVLDNEIEDEDE